MEVSKVVTTVLAMERQRVRKRGTLNTVIALLLLLIGIVSFVKVGELFWPASIENEGLFVIVGAIIIHLVVQTCLLIIYAPGYFNLLPFYDQYKINKKSS